jgi:transposase-like protein
MVDFQLITSLDLEATFPDDNACKAYLAGRRWQDKVRCPRCGNDKVYALPGFNWQCQACNSKGYRFSVLVGTAFENTKIPLKYWFRIIHMMLTSRKNMTVLEVQRNTGLGSNRSSWFLYHRVRRALTDDNFLKLMGIVEKNEESANNLRHCPGLDSGLTQTGAASVKLPSTGR